MMFFAVTFVFYLLPQVQGLDVNSSENNENFWKLSTRRSNQIPIRVSLYAKTKSGQKLEKTFEVFENEYKDIEVELNKECEKSRIFCADMDSLEILELHFTPLKPLGDPLGFMVADWMVKKVMLGNRPLRMKDGTTSFGVGFEKTCMRCNYPWCTCDPRTALLYLATKFCPERCETFNDGCNVCHCNPDSGEMEACTVRTCFHKGDEKCEKFVEQSLEVCSEAPSSGVGRAAFDHWAWQQADNRCVPFLWGGLIHGSNENRFDSEEACKQACGWLASQDDVSDDEGSADYDERRILQRNGRCDIKWTHRNGDFRLLQCPNRFDDTPYFSVQVRNRRNNWEESFDYERNNQRTCSWRYAQSLRLMWTRGECVLQQKNNGRWATVNIGGSNGGSNGSHNGGQGGSYGNGGQGGSYGNGGQGGSNGNGGQGGSYGNGGQGGSYGNGGQGGSYGNGGQGGSYGNGGQGGSNGSGGQGGSNGSGGQGGSHGKGGRGNSNVQNRQDTFI